MVYQGGFSARRVYEKLTLYQRPKTCISVTLLGTDSSV